MAVFFKGSRPGSHYWKEENDPQVHGFCGKAARMGELDDIIQHIISYSDDSPYVSITKSFSIAESYARPIKANEAGKVWELRFEGDLERALINPIQRILHHDSRGNLHDGEPTLLMRLSRLPSLSKRQWKLPPHRHFRRGEARQRTNLLIPESLEAIVNALRDSELLVDHIPSACVKRLFRID